jgi:hypothetical protein
MLIKLNYKRWLIIFFILISVITKLDAWIK